MAKGFVPFGKKGAPAAEEAPMDKMAALKGAKAAKKSAKKAPPKFTKKVTRK